MLRRSAWAATLAVLFICGTAPGMARAAAPKTKSGKAAAAKAATKTTTISVLGMT